MTGVQSSLPSSGYSNVPPPTYAADTSMESLDCLQDINFFAPQHSSPMPDYSDLSHAATQLQVLFPSSSVISAIQQAVSVPLRRRALCVALLDCACFALSRGHPVKACVCCTVQGTLAADPAAIDLSQAAAASKDSTAFLIEEARALLSYAGQYQAMEYTAEEHFTR